jgi:small subunit ribosomal protein S6
MIKDYEAIFIFDPALKEQDLEKRLQEIVNSITSKKGEILKQERIGKRKLAYPIRKHMEGDYHVLNFKAPSEVVSAIKNEYRLIPSVIRFAIVKLNPDIKTQITK